MALYILHWFNVIVHCDLGGLPWVRKPPKLELLIFAPAKRTFGIIIYVMFTCCCFVIFVKTPNRERKVDFPLKLSKPLIVFLKIALVHHVHLILFLDFD